MKPLLCFLALLAVQEPSPRLENWLSDLDELGRVISERHKKAFFKVDREVWFKAVDDVRQRIPTLKDHEIGVEFMKLAALIGDGHTGASPGPEAALKLRRYPIALMWLKDGLFVVAAAESHKELLRSRVVAVGKTPAAEAASRVGAVQASDNASGARNASANWLTVPEVLSCTGLIDDMEEGSFTLADPQGKERTVELAPVSGPPRKVLGFDRPDEFTVSRRLLRERYGFEPVGKVLYCWYDSCSDAKDKSVSAWCEEVLKAIDDRKPERIVFDLRRNGGGNSTLIRPLMAGLKKRPEATAPGKLFVLTDRPTFSSALLNAMEFRREFKAILVGLPPGGSPNHYGEIRTVTLPNCKWQVQYSTKLFKHSDDGATLLAPDVEAEWTAAEFFSGADPAFEAAAKYKP